MLASYLPERTFIAPRLMEEVRASTPLGPAQAEGMSGALMAIAGQLPILVHEAASSAALITAMRDAGIKVPEVIHRYLDREDYLARLELLQDAGGCAWFTFPVPSSMGGRGPEVVTPRCLALLNDRGAASRLVPAVNLPPRRLIEGHDAVAAAMRDLRKGDVVKLADAPASSGGRHVVIVRAGRHARRARANFAKAEAVVIERIVAHTRNLCAQVAVSSDGGVAWLGASDQVTSVGGVYLGNRIGAPIPESVRELALEIGRRGAAEGFVGVAGFDILVSSQDEPVAVDLNFRPNGSTPLLLLHGELGPARGLPFAELVFVHWNGSSDTGLAALHGAITAGWLLPTALFDPFEAGSARGPIVLRLIVMGSEADEVAARVAWLKQVGFALPAYPARGIRRLLQGWTA